MNTDKFERIASQYDTQERIKIAEICAQEIRTLSVDSKNKILIDFGSGTGLVGLKLKNDFSSLIFIDSSPNMLKEVKGKIKKNNIENAMTFCWDLENESSPDLSSDYIIVVQTLLHIRDTKSLLKKMYHLLNSGGHLIIIDFDKNEEIVSHDVHNGFSQNQLSDMASDIGFSGVSSKTFYNGNKIFMNKDASLFIMDCQRD